VSRVQRSASEASGALQTWDRYELRARYDPGSAVHHLALTRFVPHRIRDKNSYAASALAGFSGGVIAPEDLISASSFAE